MKVALHKLTLEDAAQAKKNAFVEELKADLNAGGGYRKTPLVVDNLDPEHRETLAGLTVRALHH